MEEGEGVREGDALLDGVKDLVAVRLGEGGRVGVLLGLVPRDSELVALGVALGVRKEVGLRLGVQLLVALLEGVPAGEGDLLGLEPRDRVLVGLGLLLPVRLPVLERVPERVGLPVLVRVPEALGEEVTEAQGARLASRRSRRSILMLRRMQAVWECSDHKGL